MQPDLFGDLRAEPHSRGFQPPLFPHRFIRLRVAYEDLIFSALGLILLLLGGFCLGVERGKQLELHPTADAAVAAPQPNAVQPPIMAIPAPSVKAVVVPTEAVVNRPAAKVNSKRDAGGGPYAIQLASYVDAQSARVEADRLRRRGLDPRVVKQGKYFELRLAGYRSRSEAMVPLSQLKKVYHDGFIKHLSEG